MDPRALRRPRSERTPARRVVAAALGLLLPLALVATPASAVNTDHGNRLVSTNPADNTPHAMDGSVNAIVQVGNKVIAAGTFTSVSPAATFSSTADDVTRNRIFAFDATTGQIDPSFNPNLGGAANSLTTDGTYVYVGGQFGSVGGNTAIKRVVKLTTSGAVVPGFQVVPNARVNEVVWSAGRLYVGGAFTTLKKGTVTSSRGALAALNPATGAVLAEVNVPFTGLYDPNNPQGGGSTNVKRFDVSADGRKLAAIGNFATVGGQPRAQIAVLDLPATGSAALSGWKTDRFSRARNNCSRSFDAFTRDIDFAPDGSWFAVTTTGAFAGGAGSGTMCDTTTRWETASTGNDPTWIDYSGGDTMYGVAVTGGAVYIGGHMRWANNPFRGDIAGPGAVPRDGLAALDPANGLPLSWNPGRTRGVGAQALLATSTGLWVGSDTTRIGRPRETHGRIAFMPLASGTTIPTVAPAPLPNDLFLAQRSPTGGNVTGALMRRPVGATGSPTGAATTANTAMDWSTVRGAFLVNGQLFYGLSDGGLYTRTFNRTTGVVGSQSTVNLYDDPQTGARIPFAIANLTGVFYEPVTHRLYYTVSGDNRLFYRYFTPESRVVGAQTFEAVRGGVDFSTVAGMTLAGGRVLYGSRTDGALRSVPFSAGKVSGSPTTVSNDGTWNHRAIFVANG